MYVLNSEFSEKKKSYLLTSEDDVAKLPRFEINGSQGQNPTDDEPCNFGSTALLVTGADTKVFMLMPDNQWTEL